MTSLFARDVENRSLPLPLAWKPFLATDTWVSERHSERLAFLVHVSPEGDTLPEAVDALVPSNQRKWTVTHLSDTPDGWSTYLVEYHACR